MLKRGLFAAIRKIKMVTHIPQCFMLRTRVMLRENVKKKDSPGFLPPYSCHQPRSKCDHSISHPSTIKSFGSSRMQCFIHADKTILYSETDLIAFLSCFTDLDFSTPLRLQNLRSSNPPARIWVQYRINDISTSCLCKC